MLGKCFHDMRFERCKCVKIGLRRGFRPGPRWRSLQRSLTPPPLAGFGEGKEGKGMEGRIREGKGGRGKGKGLPPSKNPGYGPATPNGVAENCKSVNSHQSVCHRWSN